MFTPRLCAGVKLCSHKIRLPCSVTEFSLILLCLSLIFFNEKGKAWFRPFSLFFQQGEYTVPDGEAPHVLQVLWQWRTINIAITTSQMDASAPRLCLASTSLDFIYSIMNNQGVGAHQTAT